MQGAFSWLKDTTWLCVNTTWPCVLQGLTHGHVLARIHFYEFQQQYTAVCLFDTVVLCLKILRHGHVSLRHGRVSCGRFWLVYRFEALNLYFLIF